MIDQLTNAGAIPALDMTMRFAAGRQKLIAHNVANLDTPNFQPKDVSPRGFQSMLRDAVDARRGRTGGTHGALEWRETREIRRPRGGGDGLSLNPRTPSGNVLFHDRNDRDLERTMQAMVENASVFRVAADLMRSRMAILDNAIGERV